MQYTALCTTENAAHMAHNAQCIWDTVHSASGTQCTAECEMREAQG